MKVPGYRKLKDVSVCFGDLKRWMAYPPLPSGGVALRGRSEFHFSLPTKDAFPISRQLWQLWGFRPSSWGWPGWPPGPLNQGTVPRSARLGIGVSLPEADWMGRWVCLKIGQPQKSHRCSFWFPLGPKNNWLACSARSPTHARETGSKASVSSPDLGQVSEWQLNCPVWTQKQKLWGPNGSPKRQEQNQLVRSGRFAQGQVEVINPLE